ncbi:MAG TPA: DUF6261 family protein [Paludibacter sp.]|nr:DUF6261 family protein [Paludibacter sp.]
MKQIIPFFMRDLQNDEHHKFHFDIKKLVDEQTADKLKINPLFASYLTALAGEDAAIKVEQGSIITKTITESDEYRDFLERGFYKFTESQTMSFDPAVRTAAEHILRKLDQYGDLRYLPYQKETDNITTRNAELFSNYAADLATAEATERLTKIDEANNEFDSHFGNRANETAARISSNVRNARILVDPAYQAVVNQINALVLVEGEANYAEFIDRVNYYINYYKAGIAARRGRKAATTSPTATK